LWYYLTDKVSTFLFFMFVCQYKYGITI